MEIDFEEDLCKPTKNSFFFLQFTNSLNPYLFSQIT